MIESIITVILVGFTAGFLFAMPIAGPISIIITSNALKGHSKFCVRTALGASIIEAVYVLTAVLGLSALVTLYSPLIPYLVIVGALFLFIIGIKIFKTDISLDNINAPKSKQLQKVKGGFRTGIIVNLTNPSFFFGIVASSFLVLTFSSSIGLNTGGLDLLITENVSTFQEIAQDNLVEFDSTYVESKIPDQNLKVEPSASTFLLSLFYAISLSTGGFLWLFILTKLLIKYRHKIKIEILTWIIRGLGIVLCGISVYLLWQTFAILFLS